MTTLFPRLLLAALLVASAVPSDAQNDGAIDAVLSLPQGLPDDGVFPTGNGNIADEPALIEVLANEVAAGADLNAYRYGGTALHHALRANLQDAALWLLAHGADPKLEVQDVEHGKPDGNDALQLAIVYRRWRVVDALLRRPLAPHTPRDLAFRWTAVFDLHADPATQDDAARELARRLAWPGGWQGGCLVDAAANRANLPMLAKAAGVPVARCPDVLPTSNARDLAAGSVAGQGALTFGREASQPNAATGRFAKLAPAELTRIDAALSQPLLPSLAALLETPADAQKWSTLPLRRPWQDAAFTRAVVQALLRTPMKPAVRDAALRSLPPAALNAALDDDATLRLWVERLWSQPLPQATATLAAIPDATLAHHAEAAIAGLAGLAPGEGMPQPYANRSFKASDKLWIALLSRLPAPVKFRSGPPILLLAPESAWPTLLARGFVPASVDVEALWAVSTLDQWRQRWALLQAAVGPQAATTVMADIVAAWTKPCEGGGCAPQPSDLDKLQAMRAAGVHPPPTVTLSTGAAHHADPATVRALLATRLVALAPGDAISVVVTATPPPDTAPHGRFELTPLTCAPEPATGMVLAALREQFLADPRAGEPPPPQTEAAAPAWFQPVTEPGAKRCAWLVTGGEVASRMSFDEDDFYQGRNHFTPCGEATLHGEVWRQVDGRVVATPWDEGADGGALALQESGGARRFVLALPFRGGTCDAGRQTALYEWVGDASTRRLVLLANDGPSRLAFDAQCNVDDPAPCFGLPSVDDAAIQPDAPESMLLQSTFAERFGAGLRQRWLDAFQAGDFTALRSPDLSAPMAEWRQAALVALTASPLPLDQKRQRIAWMFRDKAGMAASFGPSTSQGSVLLGLVAWLPREDWRPMLAAIGQDEPLLLSLRDAATARGDARLACTFAKAAGRDCVAGPAKKP